MSTATRAWTMVNRHIPMIKFRKAASTGQDHVAVTASPSSVKQAPVTQKAKQPVYSTIIEDWQLSDKYKRRTLSLEEIEYINRGGPQ